MDLGVETLPTCKYWEYPLVQQSYSLYIHLNTMHVSIFFSVSSYVAMGVATIVTNILRANARLVGIRVSIYISTMTAMEMPSPLDRLALPTNASYLK